MPQDRGFNAGITGIISFRDGTTPQFTVDVRSFRRKLTHQTKPRNGRTTGRWSKTRVFRPDGLLVLGGLVKKEGFPLPNDWKPQEGTVVAQYHKVNGTVVQETLSVRVIEHELGIDDKVAQDQWRVSLVCQILASPTQSGFDGTQPTATSPTASNVELYDGLSKTHDPKNLLDSGTRLFEIWPLGDTDSDERQAIINIIASAAAPFPTAKVKVGNLVPGRDAEAGTITIQYALTDSEEDVVNPATFTTTDANKLESGAQATGVFEPPADPGGDFVETTTTTQEIHDAATRTTKQYELLDTKQKVEFPGTVTGNDPYDLADEATITQVHNTSAVPSDPTAPLGQLVQRSTTQINRYRWRTTWSYANLNSEQREEFPAANLITDSSSLVDEDRQSDVTDSSTAPSTPTTRISGLQLRTLTSKRIGGTPEKWLHVWEFGRRTTEEDIEMPGTVTDDDPSNLGDEATITLVTSSATPSIPGAPLGVHVGTQTTQIHATRWKHIYRYANTTNAQKVTFPRSPIGDDPSDLTDTDTQTEINGSSTPPAPPATRVAGTKLRRTTSVRLSGTPEQWLHTFEFARRNEEDDVEQGNTAYQVDQSGNVVAGSARVTVVEADSTPDGGVTVSGLVLRFIEKKQLHDSKWEMTYVFGQNTPEQDIELPDTIYENDPSNLTDVARVALVNSSSTYPVALDTPPSTPTTGTLKLRRIKSVQLTSGGQWVHTGYYGLNTEEDDVEMSGGSTTDCQSDLADAQVIVVVTGSGTPSNPGTPSGLKYREVITKQLNDGKWRHEYRYTRTDREDDVEFGETSTILDAEALESGGTIGVINTSATPPAAPSAPATDTKLISTTTKQLHGAATPKYVHIFKYAVRTTEEDIEWLQSKAIVEAGELDRRPVTVEVTSSSTPGSGTNPDATNLSLYATISHRVTDTQYVHVFQWAPLTATEETVAKGSETTIDSNVAASPPASLEKDDRVVSITASATPAAADADAAGRICYRIETVRLAKVKWRHTYHYGFRSNESKLEADRTQTTTDAQNLEHSAVTADVWLVSGGAPVDPSAPASPTGLKLVEKTDIEVPNPLYRVRVYKWALTDSKDAIELPGSILRYTPFTNISRRLTTVEASTDSLVTIGEAMRTTHKSDVTVDAFEVQRINTAYVRKVVEYITSYQNLKVRVYGGWNYYSTRFTGANVQVYVSQVVARGDGLYEVLLTEQMQWCSRVDFTITQRRNLTNVRTFFEKIGTRNNDTFIGIASGYVTYLGGEPETERSFDAPHVMAERFSFRFDSRGLYEATGVSMGWFTTDVSVSVGWVDADTFGWGGFGLPSADYSDFLA